MKNIKNDTHKQEIGLLQFDNLFCFKRLLFITGNLLVIAFSLKIKLEQGEFAGSECNLPEPASTHMKVILEFNRHLLAIAIIFTLLINWLIFYMINLYLEYQKGEKSSVYSRSNMLGNIGNSMPTIVLIKIATPLFFALHAMVEKSMPQISLKIIGNQWFWAGEISDLEYRNERKASRNKLTYTCYLLAEDEFNQKDYAGFFRLLETTKRILLPVGVEVKLLVTSLDVLHSWSVPSLGIKVDACPGKLSQLSFVLKRVGAFYGQCSEICGINHGFMPIVLVVCSKDMLTNTTDPCIMASSPFPPLPPEGPQTKESVMTLEEMKTSDMPPNELDLGVLVKPLHLDLEQMERIAKKIENCELKIESELQSSSKTPDEKRWLNSMIDHFNRSKEATQKYLQASIESEAALIEVKRIRNEFPLDELKLDYSTLNFERKFSIFKEAEKASKASLSNAARADIRNALKAQKIVRDALFDRFQPNSFYPKSLTEVRSIFSRNPGQRSYLEFYIKRIISEIDARDEMFKAYLKRPSYLEPNFEENTRLASVAHARSRKELLELFSEVNNKMRSLAGFYDQLEYHIKLLENKKLMESDELSRRYLDLVPDKSVLTTDGCFKSSQSNQVNKKLVLNFYTIINFIGPLSVMLVLNLIYLIF